MKIFTKADTQLVLSLITLVILYAWIAFLCALSGVFYSSLVFLLWGIGCFILFYMRIIVFPRPSKNAVLLGASILMITIFLLSITTPTVFEGRDQGALAIAATALAQHHHTQFHTPESDMFFAIYGPGKALHFPGFYYTHTGALTTQFPLPYIAFLAGFIGVFGLSGLFVAQGILFMVFAITIMTFAARYFTRKSLLLFGTLLFTTAPILYVALFTLSENFANALFFSALLVFVLYRESKDSRHLLLLLSTISLLLFTRIEGLWLFGIVLFVLLRDSSLRNTVRHTTPTTMALILSLFVSIAITTLIVNFSFYKTMATVLYQHMSSSLDVATSPASSKIFLLTLLQDINLLIPLGCTLGVTIYIFFRQKDKRHRLLPLLFAAPLFLYFIAPQISRDAPWMIRRYTFILAPLLMFYTLYLSTRFATTHLSKKIATVCIVLLIAYNVIIDLQLIFPTDHASLLAQTQRLAQRFTPHDLLLLSPSVSGDRYAMLGAPLRALYGRHSVYFFNPDDVAAIDTSAFAHIYLIVADKDKPLFKDLLASDTPDDTLEITTSVRPPQSTLPLSFAQHTTTTRSAIYKLR